MPDNLSFEEEGASTDPMAPNGWAVSVTSTGEEIADFDAYAESAEDFSEGWEASIASLVPASDPFTSPHIIATSLREPFALSDLQEIQFTRDGANLVVVVFNTIDFLDITTATANEVRIVMDAALAVSGYAFDVALGRVRVQSSPFGEAIAVVGQGTANEGLGFPTVYNAFAGPSLDIGTVSWFGGESTNDFESAWAGIPALLASGIKEPFAISNGNTLNVSVNGVAQVVTFASITVGGAATAAEIRADLNAQLTAVGGEATATDIAATDVLLRSDLAATGASLDVTGGTAIALLGFYPTGGFTVGSGFIPAFSGGTAALFDTTTPENIEDFEEEWLTNEDFVWILTANHLRVTAVAIGTVYNLQLTSGELVEDYSYTAITGDLVTDVIDDFEAQLNANSALVTTSDLGGGTLELMRSDNRSEIVYTVSTSTGVVSIEIGTPSLSAEIAAASFDSGTPEDVADFEDEWLNDSGTWAWTLVPQYVQIVTNDVGTVYSITLDVAENVTTFSYTALGGDSLADIAVALAALIQADSRFTAVDIFTDSVFVLNNDSRTLLNVTTSDDADLFFWAALTNGGVIEAASFGRSGGNDDFEAFPSASIIDHQMDVTFGGSDPAPAGTYTFSVLGAVFEHVSGGADSRATIATAFRDAINSSSVRLLAGANVVGQTLEIASVSCPKVVIDVSAVSSPSAVIDVDPVDTTQFYSDLRTMCTI